VVGSQNYRFWSLHHPTLPYICDSECPVIWWPFLRYEEMQSKMVYARSVTSMLTNKSTLRSVDTSIVCFFSMLPLSTHYDSECWILIRS